MKKHLVLKLFDVLLIISDIKEDGYFNLILNDAIFEIFEEIVILFKESGI